MNGIKIYMHIDETFYQKKQSLCTKYFKSNSLALQTLLLRNQTVKYPDFLASVKKSKT